MRVTAGIYRGRTLRTLPGEAMRPTLDAVRQAIFNVLQFRLSGTRVLDLFAGSGALGIEALSRGAASAVLCDASREAAALIAQNAVMCRNAEIYCRDYREMLSECVRSRRVFDIVFLDPPYRTRCGVNALDGILRGGLLASGGTAVFERERYGAEDGGETPDYTPPDGINVSIKSKFYGSVKVEFITLREDAKP